MFNTGLQMILKKFLKKFSKKLFTFEKMCDIIESENQIKKKERLKNYETWNKHKRNLHFKKDGRNSYKLI